MHAFDRRRDGRTDRRTDGRTEFSSSDRVCIPCSAVQKPGLDETSPGSYRPISNVPVLSKLLKRLVVRHFVWLFEYLSSADLIPPLESGFRPCHSTEADVLWVLSDILQAVDRGDLAAALVFLDLSAACDTVDHSIRPIQRSIQRLQLTFGISDVAHHWFRSCLCSRK